MPKDGMDKMEDGCWFQNGEFKHGEFENIR